MGAIHGRLLEALESRIAQPPAIQWFDRWEPAIEDALCELPSSGYCPTDLLRELFEVSLSQKRLALVAEAGEPLAVVPLKHVYGRWRLLTTWMLPSTLFPARPGQHIRALAALGMPVFVQWWRHRGATPRHVAIREYRDIPAHRIECAAEDEAHWRKTGLLKTIRRSRKRCTHLRTEINRAGAARWTIEHWGRHWAADGQASLPGTEELLAVARYWEPRGRHVTISLADGDEIAAAVTLFVHDDDLVAMCNYRRREYDRMLVGTRVLDAAHQWALATGKASIDFGSEHEYLRRWAPADGTVSEFVVSAPESFTERLVRAANSGLSLVLPKRD